jgi:hypothetical protein
VLVGGSRLEKRAPCDANRNGLELWSWRRERNKSFCTGKSWRLVNDQVINRLTMP